MEVKANYKSTEVGTVPLDWDVIEILDACKLINGRGFRPFEWKTEGLPIIRIQNLNGSDEFNYYHGAYDKKLEVERGQLLFAWSGSRGTSFGPHIWKGQKGLLNYHTWKVLIDEEKVQKSFFTHALRRLTKYIEDNAHGASALVHVQKWQMEKFKFALPKNKKEQAAIATALSDTDALITGLENLIAKKRNIKQGVMQELFKRKKEWKLKKIKDIAPLQRGYDLPSKELRDGPYPVAYSNGIINHHIEYQVKAPGIVTGRSGTIGKVNYIERDFWPHNTTLWVTNFKGNYPKFIYYLFQHIKIEQFATGSGVPTLNRNDVHQFVVHIPSFEEQVQIANVISDIDLEIAALQAKLQKYRQIKTGMMQTLLTGQIRLV